MSSLFMHKNVKIKNLYNNTFVAEADDRAYFTSAGITQAGVYVGEGILLQITEL